MKLKSRWVGIDMSSVTSSLTLTPSLTPRHQPWPVSPSHQKKGGEEGREGEKKREEQKKKEEPKKEKKNTIITIVIYLKTI